jgi:hypothetical protein
MGNARGTRKPSAGALRATGLLFCVALLLVGAAGPASASTWTVTELKDDQVGGPLFGVSCPSPDLCVATGSDSLVATSTNPTGGPAAWRVFHPGGREDHEAPIGEGGLVFPGAQIRGVSCPSTRLCIGAALDGRIFSSTNPAGGASAWKIAPLSGDEEPNIHMTGISCPSPALCVVVAYGSKVLYSSNPTGDASAWAVTELADRLDLRGVSCPTVSFCAAVDNEGSIVTSTNPIGPASAWNLVGRPAGIEGLNGISCPSVSLCVTGNASQIVTSTNPTGGLSSWNAAAAGTGLPVKGVSCPTTLACAAVDNNADVLISTNPTGGPGAWSFKNVIPAPLTPDGGPNGMFGLSCPTTSLCVGVGALEQIITSADPFAPDAAKLPIRKSKRPRVVITRHPAKRINPRKKGVKVAFRFHAIGKAARFTCKTGGRRFRTCKSPLRYRVGRGTHVFRVRAISPTGAKGPPATFHFKVAPFSEPQPVGSCRNRPSRFPFDPCIRAR